MVAAFQNAQRAYGKPFIFTEIGYRSGDGANRAPWDWGASLAADPAEQADCYAAMYDVWSREASWMKGPFWWAWDVARRPPETAATTRAASPPRTCCGCGRSEGPPRTRAANREEAP